MMLNQVTNLVQAFHEEMETNPPVFPYPHAIAPASKGSAPWTPRMLEVFNELVQLGLDAEVPSVENFLKDVGENGHFNRAKLFQAARGELAVGDGGTLALAAVSYLFHLAFSNQYFGMNWEEHPATTLITRYAPHLLS